MRNIFRVFTILLCVFLLAACQPGASAVNDPPAMPDASASAAESTITPVPTATPEATPRPVYMPDKEDVQLWDKATPLSGTLYFNINFAYIYLYEEFNADREAFMALHPGVVITFIDETLAENDNFSDFGDGVHITDIVNSGFREFLAFADEGKLVDLRQYMEADPDFNMDDYYMNVFDAYIYKGGQYAFPLSFSYDLAAMSKDAPPELVAEFTALDSVTYPHLMDLFARSGLEKQKHMMSCTTFDHLVYDAITRDFIDYENKTCDFDNEHFVNLLTSRRTVYEENMEGKIEAVRGYLDRRATEEYERKWHLDNYLFKRTVPYEKQYFFPGFSDTNLLADSVPLVNAHGELPIYTTDLFAISADSPNKALAWEFLKYLASEEVQSRRVFSEPVVNRAAFAAAEADTIALFLENDAYYNPDMAPLVGDITAMTAEAIATHDKWNQMPMTIYTGMQRSVLNPVYTAIDMYLYNVYTAEQTAAAAQEGASAALEALR